MSGGSSALFLYYFSPYFHSQVVTPTDSILAPCCLLHLQLAAKQLSDGKFDVHSKLFSKCRSDGKRDSCFLFAELKQRKIQQEGSSPSTSKKKTMELEDMFAIEAIDALLKQFEFRRRHLRRHHHHRYHPALQLQPFSDTRQRVPCFLVVGEDNPEDQQILAVLLRLLKIPVAMCDTGDGLLEAFRQRRWEAERLLVLIDCALARGADDQKRTAPDPLNIVLLPLQSFARTHTHDCTHSRLLSTHPQHFPLLLASGGGGCGTASPPPGLLMGTSSVPLMLLGPAHEHEASFLSTATNLTSLTTEPPFAFSAPPTVGSISVRPPSVLPLGAAGSALGSAAWSGLSIMPMAMAAHPLVPRLSLLDMPPPSDPDVDPDDADADVVEVDDDPDEVGEAVEAVLVVDADREGAAIPESGSPGPLGPGGSPAADQPHNHPRAPPAPPAAARPLKPRGAGWPGRHPDDSGEEVPLDEEGREAEGRRTVALVEVECWPPGAEARDEAHLGSSISPALHPALPLDPPPAYDPGPSAAPPAALPPSLPPALPADASVVSLDASSFSEPPPAAPAPALPLPLLAAPSEETSGMWPWPPLQLLSQRSACLSTTPPTPLGTGTPPPSPASCCGSDQLSQPPSDASPAAPDPDERPADPESGRPTAIPTPLGPATPAAAGGPNSPWGMGVGGVPPPPGYWGTEELLIPAPATTPSEPAGPPTVLGAAAAAAAAVAAAALAACPPDPGETDLGSPRGQPPGLPAAAPPASPAGPEPPPPQDDDEQPDDERPPSSCASPLEPLAPPPDENEGEGEGEDEDDADAPPAVAELLAPRRLPVPSEAWTRGRGNSGGGGGGGGCGPDAVDQPDGAPWHPAAARPSCPRAPGAWNRVEIPPGGCRHSHPFLPPPRGAPVARCASERPPSPSPLGDPPAVAKAGPGADGEWDLVPDAAPPGAVEMLMKSGAPLEAPLSLHALA
ncbi:hypothetical protein PAPYR_4538 [Paratrimastix pyriformis]|uniref:Uncharacterized protein n=1 Tax=Paratrimastix pyriformis TaxID=342808 RepID=A0ABQ8UL00_9EUKA|nr:hypothetical protein PAPYR_4538 [Paratrimastix pyriformis]